MEIKRCGLYIRVSTGEQAKVEEGSLKNQRLALEAFVNSKSGIDGSKWIITDTYIDEGRSAKDTKRPQYQRMVEDIRRRIINAILCTALSRISRSTRHLLEMVEWLNNQKVDFISLKEQFDTTTAQGKCFLTIMAALNQFEREQTSERTRFNMFARAQRGLSHGCYITGYDLDPDKKGRLIPNQEEANLVNLIFDTHLSSGSILRTAKIINDKGCVSKKFTSIKTGKDHGGKKFCYTSVHNILTNYAYIGKREINKMNKAKDQAGLPEDQRYSICNAVWPAIVDEKKFQNVQELLADNLKHKNNGAAPTKHSYLFNGELVYCEKCGSRMEGRSTHKHKGIYYYYFCVNKDCRFRVRENELEAAIQKIIIAVSSRQPTLSRITNRLNERLVAQLPEMREEKHRVEAELEALNSQAKKIMNSYLSVENGKEFVEKHLAELDGKRVLLKNRLQGLEAEIDSLQRESIDEARVKGLFGCFEEIFKDNIKFYQKRILLKWILRNVRINTEELSLGIDSNRFRSDITQILRGDMIPEVPRGSQI